MTDPVVSHPAKNVVLVSGCALRFSGRTWSLLLAVTAMLRATSYWWRPPRDFGSDHPAAHLIEGTMGYPVWALGLGACAVMIGVGLVKRTGVPGLWLLLLGHAVLFAAYVSFALTAVVIAYSDGAQWAGIAPVVLVALLHTERVRTVGAMLVTPNFLQRFARRVQTHTKE